MVFVVVVSVEVVCRGMWHIHRLRNWLTRPKKWSTRGRQKYLVHILRVEVRLVLFILIPTTTSVVAETMDLAHRPGLGPQLEVSLDWVPIKMEPTALA